jgi:hypothetical protein
MLVYNFNNNTDSFSIRIKLLDNSFTSTWKDYVIRISQRLPKLSWVLSSHNDIFQTYSNEDYSSFILNSIKSFTLLGKHYQIDYSQEITELNLLLVDRNSLTQHHLNKWHRHFTSLANLTQTNKAVPTFTDSPADIIHDAIHELNTGSHALESLTYPNLTRLTNLTPNHLRYSLYSREIWKSDMIEYINEDFDFNTQSYNHTVWLTDDILGKDHFKCWFEEDDPSNDDVTGNLLMTPNVTFDPNRIFEKTIDDPEFKKFVTDSNKKLNRYPLGDIENINDIPWGLGIGYFKLKNIELDGKILWVGE